MCLFLMLGLHFLLLSRKHCSKIFRNHSSQVVFGSLLLLGWYGRRHFTLFQFFREIV